MTPVEVRKKLVEALQLDLVGPQGSNGAAAEVLPQHPSRWYLTGFLVPFDAGEAQSSDPDAGDDIDGNGDGAGTDDDVVPERVAASKTRFPSSMGLSVLLPLQTKPSNTQPRSRRRLPWPDESHDEILAGRAGVGCRVSGVGCRG